MNAAELLSEPFMQRALLAALFTGLAAPAVGTFLVLLGTTLIMPGEQDALNDADTATPDTPPLASAAPTGPPSAHGGNTW